MSQPLLQPGSPGISGPFQNTQQTPLVRIGHYRLGKTLGIGSFGKVKREYYSLSIFLLYFVTYANLYSTTTCSFYYSRYT